MPTRRPGAAPRTRPTSCSVRAGCARWPRRPSAPASRWSPSTTRSPRPALRRRHRRARRRDRAGRLRSPRPPACSAVGADDLDDVHRAVPRLLPARRARPHRRRPSRVGRRAPAPAPTSRPRGVAPTSTDAEGLRREAADAVEVVRRLWDSWEDDAVIRHVASSRYLDRDRLHYIDFTGETYAVKGPAIVPRPPQGQVVVLASPDLVPTRADRRRAGRAGAPSPSCATHSPRPPTLEALRRDRSRTRLAGPPGGRAPRPPGRPSTLARHRAGCATSATPRASSRCSPTWPTSPTACASCRRRSTTICPSCPASSCRS